MANAKDMGCVGHDNVPTEKVGENMGVIYGASTTFSAMNNFIPEKLVNKEDLYDRVTIGRAGMKRVPFEAVNPNVRLKYLTQEDKIEWNIYPYEILDSAKKDVDEGIDLRADQLRSAAEYFGALKDYYIIEKLLANAGNTISDVTDWDASGGDVEGDLVNAWGKILSTARGLTSDFIKTIVVVPADIYGEVNKLQLINNVQQQLREYMKISFSMTTIPYTPYKTYDESGNEITDETLDALGDHALLFIPGEMTARLAIYNPARAGKLKFPLAEGWREHGRGEAYFQKMGMCCFGRWDGVATRTSATDYDNNRIVKITDVT